MRSEDQRWSPIEWTRVPRSSAILLAIGAHLIVLPLLFFYGNIRGRIHVLPQPLRTVQRISGRTQIAFNAKPSTVRVSPLHVNRRRTSRAPQSQSTGQGNSAQILRQQAKEATAAITQSIRFRQLYGFSPMHEYQLAVQTAGEIPMIPAEQVPPHFQQYVIIEVTIDTEGSVAEARIVSGLVSANIEQTLLAAIREFKYNPAKRDGVPIPSQRDIVIHIPT